VPSLRQPLSEQLSLLPCGAGEDRNRRGLSTHDLLTDLRAFDPAEPSLCAFLSKAPRPRAPRVARRRHRRRTGGAAARGRLGGAPALLLGSPTFFRERARIGALGLQLRLPIMATSREGVGAGALLNYGTSIPHLFRRAADYADKVLRGANPADLPVEQPTNFELSVNLSTARAIGVILSPQFLSRADEVIFLDIVMPGMDGFEVLKALSRVRCSAPIIVISGYNAAYLENAAKLSEAYGLPVMTMSKPVRIEEIREVLRGLGSSKAHQAEC
jgi:CheY-like chemotaxis protein